MFSVGRIGLGLLAATCAPPDYSYANGVITPGASYYHDTVTSEVVGSGANVHFKHEAFARLRLRTSATQIKIWAVGQATANDKIGVRVNGVFLSEHSLPAYDGTRQSITVTVGAGTNKIVEIVEGARQASHLWVSVQAIEEVNGPIELLEVVAPSKRIVVYGDSISVGYSSSRFTDYGWTSLLRWQSDDYGFGLTVSGYGGRRLLIDAPDAAGRTALAAQLVAACQRVQSGGTKRLFLAIGTNDFGLSSGSSATFGTAYADLLDKINAADPDIDVFCLTPTGRTDEAEKTGGYGALSAYRTAIATAVSTRTAYATLIDGSAILNTGTDLADAVHPNDAGHVKIFNALRGYALPTNGARYSEDPETGRGAGLYGGVNIVTPLAADAGTGAFVINEGVAAATVHLLNCIVDTTLIRDAMPVKATVRLAADTASRCLVAGKSGAMYASVNLSTGVIVGTTGGVAHLSAPTIVAVGSPIDGHQFYDVTIHFTHATGEGVRVYVDNDAGGVAYTGTNRQILIERVWVRPAYAPDEYVQTAASGIG